MNKFEVTANDHVIGNEKAEITLIEYGDYQCPYCRQAHYFIQKLIKELGYNFRYVFRHFPMRNAHEFALLTSQAVEAAGLQGKFWEMHEILYDEQLRVDDESIFDLAEEIELDLDKFKVDLKLESIMEKIDSDFEKGARSGVSGTPGLYVNGKKYELSLNLDIFLKKWDKI